MRQYVLPVAQRLSLWWGGAGWGGWVGVATQVDVGMEQEEDFQINFGI